MLKKVVIVVSVAAAAGLGVAGVAHASEDYSTDCSSYEVTKQYTGGHQLIGGNGYAHDINGFIGGSIDKPGFCPSAFNNNDIDLKH